MEHLVGLRLAPERLANDHEAVSDQDHLVHL